MIYLASPYTHLDDSIQYARFLAARDFIYNHMQTNKRPIFSPNVYGRQFEKAYGVGGDYKTWLAFNLQMISACDQVWVLMLDGWSDSKGVAAEIALAQDLALPIHYVGVK